MIDHLYVATDNDRIISACEEFKVEVVQTSKKHKCGTDRIGEAVKQVSADIVINIQADNFGFKAAILDRLIGKFISDKVDYATIAHRINNDKALFDSNLVKVIMHKNSNALWFSRYPLPYLNQVKRGTAYKRFPFLGHIGIYFFTRRGLGQFCRWSRGVYEKEESLEQLRILENNEKMRVYLTKSQPVSVDVKEDLKKLKRLYK